MDRFALSTGIIGTVFILICIGILISIVLRFVRKKMRMKRFLTSFVFLVICGLFSLSCIYLSLFIQTFSRYTHEEKIGTIVAQESGQDIQVYYVDEINETEHFFTVDGDQWMVEGCILRWSLLLRWLGADSYYRVTRFRGRWEVAEGKHTKEYTIQPQGWFWGFLLKRGQSLPFIDAAYGIGVYQYPSTEPYSLYINDTGFILRKSK
jgi:hypothetical protein